MISDSLNASRERRILAAIFGLALVLRAATLFFPYSFYPDQLFQYLEIAHRHVFGYGITTWEQRYGIRSPLFPLMLSAPMALGHWLSPNGFTFLLATKGALALASLGVIWGSYRIGRLLSPSHGLFAAFVSAIWFEFIYFSTQAFTESFALGLFFPAAAILLDRERSKTSPLILGGALLATAALIRFQYGPALALFGMMVCGRDFSRWFWAGVGAFIALAISLLVDLSQGLEPLSWLFANVHQNITLGRSHLYSTQGPFYYVEALFITLAPWVGFFLVIGWTAGRTLPPLVVTALANFLVHTGIAHKEYRFILLSSSILILIAALGTADYILRTKSAQDERRRAFKKAALAWVGASLVVALNGTNRWAFTIHRAELMAFQWLHSDKRACGVAIHTRHWSETGAYTYLHRPLPLYIIDEEEAPYMLATTQAAYNMFLIPRFAKHHVPKGYRLERCFSNPRDSNEDFCLYRRPGPCDATAGQAVEFNAWLKRHDY